MSELRIINLAFQCMNEAVTYIVFAIPCHSGGGGGGGVGGSRAYFKLFVLE